ncbi:hypothetical protein [Hymenobacter nivis]|uniref:hypothetical protein n=1 Tax=Hymenobacter nivis TaxID=1850093 RepID=UPI0013754FA7|nr:hypothetical protein [Hymenobacter nivis]
MIRPNHHPMERGTKLQSILREAQTVIALGGSSTFSAVYSAAVSVFRDGFFMPAPRGF